MTFPKPSKTKCDSMPVIIKRLDGLVSLYVRIRDGVCVTCGSRRELQCGHFISRSFFPVRWDLRNCNAQCQACNTAHEEDTTKYRAFMVSGWGQSIIDQIEALAGSGKKITRPELLVIEADIRLRIKQMTVTGGNQ